MAVAVVANVDEAIAHINKYSTKHSDSIVTATKRTPGNSCAEWIPLQFTGTLRRVSRMERNSASAPRWASARRSYTAAGPFALAELTSSKYEIVGTGQIRS